MKNSTKALFKAISIFGTISVGCGITSMIEYGVNIHTVGLTVLSVLVALSYKYATVMLNSVEDVELD